MKVTATTKLYAITGDPICHSRSPRMHNLALEQARIDGVFLAFQGNLSNIEDVIKAFRTLQVQGGSVTMPVKSAAAKLMDRLSREAQLIGAINVFHNENGELVGYNTDGMGFVMMLDEHEIPYKGKRVVQAGVGGAGRAVAVQMALSGVRELVLCDLDEEKAEQTARMICENVPGCHAVSCPANEESLRAQLLLETALYVDCTPLGMPPREDQSMISSFDGIPKELYVVDICYAPPKTKLLKMAEEHGCRILNGMDMMFNQGAKAFEIWTGQQMPLDYVKEHF